VISEKRPPAFLTKAWSERLLILGKSEAFIAEIERISSEHRLKQTFNNSDDRIARPV
jgi:hypothetical protein